MVLKVCVGSSCHLKGSYEVIMRLRELVSENNAEQKIELQASFCHGGCVHGVVAKIEEIDEEATIKPEECNCEPGFNIEEDGSIVLHKLSVDNIDDVFINRILPLAF